MTKTPQQIEKEVGLYLNQQNADLTILKVTMQVLIWNLIRRDADALGALGHLRDEVLASLYQTMSAAPPDGESAKEVERLRQLALIRAEKMFQDIEQTLGAKGAKREPRASSAN
jgi:hypothetical protein